MGNRKVVKSWVCSIFCEKQKSMQTTRDATTEFQYHGKSLGKHKALSNYVFLILRAEAGIHKTSKAWKVMNSYVTEKIWENPVHFYTMSSSKYLEQHRKTYNAKIWKKLIPIKWKVWGTQTISTFWTAWKISNRGCTNFLSHGSISQKPTSFPGSKSARKPNNPQSMATPFF